MTCSGVRLQITKKSIIMKTSTGLIMDILLGTLCAAEAQPRISTQPRDRFLEPGTSAVFTVSAASTTPLRYQWFCNGTLWLNATNASLILTNARPNLNADYCVVVSDDSGSVTSRV